MCKENYFGNKYKKPILAFLIALVLLLLAGCGGNIRSTVIKEVPSDIYSADEINDAISLIIKEFSGSWSVCTLKEITYAGDKTTARMADEYLGSNYEDFAESWGEFDDVIILTSSFEVDASGGDGSLNPNSTYTNWQWILVRNDGGSWRHVDHGY